MDREQAKFEGWAVCDILGHQRYVGYVTTEAFGQAVLFRIDVPPLEAREHVLKRSMYFPNRGYLPAGTTVQEGPVPGYTKLIGAGAIYAVTPCDEAAAMAAVEAAQPRPLINATLPPERALAEGVSVNGPYDDRGLEDTSGDDDEEDEIDPDAEDEDDDPDHGDQDGLP